MHSFPQTYFVKIIANTMALIEKRLYGLFNEL